MNTEKKRRQKEFNKVVKSSPTYIDPWGMYGGLFSSVLLVLILLTAYATGEINNIDVFIVSLVALLGGTLHSKTIAALNLETTFHAMTSASLISAGEAVKEAGDTIDKLAKEIEKLKEVQDRNV